MLLLFHGSLIGVTATTVIAEESSHNAVVICGDDRYFVMID